MYTHTITLNNKTYTFKLHNNLQNTLQLHSVYFESPITGEFIEILPPFSLNKYSYILTKHIQKYA